jgi:tRNA (mo5U34)-methyltransferase
VPLLRTSAGAEPLSLLQALFPVPEVTRDVSSLTDQDVRERIDAVAHWYHQIEIRPGIVTPGVNPSAVTLQHLDLPERCDGMRVLDIGARDGYFSFELERRGADVVAIDYMDPAETGFPVARELLGSEVEYVVDNVYRLSPDRHGEFDLVLFLGVLYHLRDPLLALDRIWDVCRDGGQVAVETQLLDNAMLRPNGSFTALKGDLVEIALAQFYPGAALNGDPSNYWSPNAACMRGLLQESGFAPTHSVVLGTRGIFQGTKTRRREQAFHRALEKSTLPEVAAASALLAVPSTPPGDGTLPDGREDEALRERVKRLEHDLAVQRHRAAGLDAELGGAREYIASLESTLARKEVELVRLQDARDAPPPASPQPPRPGPVRRAELAARSLAYRARGRGRGRGRGGRPPR